MVPVNRFNLAAGTVPTNLDLFVTLSFRATSAAARSMWRPNQMYPLGFLFGLGFEGIRPAVM